VVSKKGKNSTTAAPVARGMGFVSAIRSAALNSNFEPQQENGIRRDRIQLPIRFRSTVRKALWPVSAFE
jgi:hypothetical protein